MSGYKRLPYGISDFTDLRRAGCYYVEKNRYVPTLEVTGRFLCLIRMQMRTTELMRVGEVEP